MRVLGGCASDIGSTRKINQDGILFRCLKQHKQYFAIGAVCDGIGGLENGELSSAMIIAEINSWMQSVSQWMDISVIDPKTLYSHLPQPFMAILQLFRLLKNARKEPAPIHTAGQNPCWNRF